MKRNLKYLKYLAFILPFLFQVKQRTLAQTTLYSQYMLNKFLVNPAFAGAEGYTSINLSARKNWLNQRSAPRIVSVSGHTRIMSKSRFGKSMSIRRRTKRRRPKGRVGVGGNIYTDQNAATSKTGFQATYSYHLPIRSSQLSFGLTGSFFQFKIDKENLNTQVPDPTLDKLEPRILPDASFGVFYTIYGYYIGYSSTQLFGNLSSYSFSNDFQSVPGRGHTILTGYQYDFENDFEIEGSLLLRYSEKERLERDINIRGVYMRNYWLGFSYKSTKELVSFIGGGVQNFYFGYSFEYTTSATQVQAFGKSAHEIFVGYKMGDNRRRYRWLNRF